MDRIGRGWSAIASKIKIADRVHFLGERDDVPRLMPHFDVLWLASEYEGQSNAIMEAMAAARAGHRHRYSRQPRSRRRRCHGYLVPLGDRFEFTRRTHWLLDDAALRQRLGEAGRERVRREFTVEQMVARHAALYREVVIK